MKSDGNGAWVRNVIIPPGEYEYKFIVDGQWKEDPQNDQLALNCFGTYNNIINVTEKNKGPESFFKRLRSWAISLSL